ncbi:MAG TPA: hypothetical protein VFM23_01395 [Gemmatimonadales bacterium]|nr:hypothetical protein [Gemmatimonadales bacterium]
MSTGLKDIVRATQPAPYYHFEYDSRGRVAFVSFASEFTRYDVSYAGGRISEMRNNILVNHDQLVYVYDDSGRVALIREQDDTGGVFERLVFTYQGLQLTGVERDRRVAGGFIIDKTMSLSYYPDGNLRELAWHRPAIIGIQPEQNYADLFEQYDTGTNVDGFDLLHDEFFDHLVLLPDVVLQKGNPGRVTRSGTAETFVADFSYTYDGSNRPLTRRGVVTITSGTNAGRQFQTSSVFSYY